MPPTTRKSNAFYIKKIHRLCLKVIDPFVILKGFISRVCSINTNVSITHVSKDVAEVLSVCHRYSKRQTYRQQSRAEQRLSRYRSQNCKISDKEMRKIKRKFLLSSFTTRTTILFWEPRNVSFQFCNNRKT